MPVAIKEKKTPEIKCGAFSLRLGERTHLMGILNRTPDSFSDGGNFMDEDAAIRHAKRMETDGADIIDIGGESTRPGAESVNLSEELNRTIPIIKKLSKELCVPVSIDTRKHEVALEAIRAGATIVNDITGLKFDPKMAGVISESGACVCLMHMKGTPRDMQVNPAYEDLIHEIIEGLRESIDIALRGGIPPDKIIVDPGIGFGKTVEHNLIILNRLRELEVLGKPMLIGVSRKSFIGKVLNRDVGERVVGTASACALSIANGADIIRVHDVREMADVARVADAIKGQKL